MTIPQKKYLKNVQSMQITLDMTDAQMLELAKIIYVANFVFDSSDARVSKGYAYPHMDTFNKTMRIVNKALMPYLRESRYLEVDEKSDITFTHTIKMEPECEKILNQFGEDDYHNRVCSAITRRDYAEQYGGDDEGGMYFENSPFDILYKHNMEELKEYGLDRFRIME